MNYQIYRLAKNSLEYGFYIETTDPLTERELELVTWPIAETFQLDKTSRQPHFANSQVVEIGPRLSIETPFSSNAVAIYHSMGLKKVARVERTSRYLVSNDNADLLLENHLDRMTQEHYKSGIVNFNTGALPEEVQTIDLIGCGKGILEKINATLGLGMDTWDIDYNYDLFVNVLHRNPTDVEWFQLGNANSDHCRHWFFKGRQIIDGVTLKQTLFEMVQQPLKLLGNPNSSLVAFRDNAGVNKGFNTFILLPSSPGKPSQMCLCLKSLHSTCTAETHNHPTFVAPFPGAQTGAGGRIRDNSAVGRGAIIGIGAAGYFVGNLFIDGYTIAGEKIGKNKPSKYASALEILIGGSDGISSYGNEIGEPLTHGFTRSFGQIVDGQWREPRKPILYSAGVGTIFDEHVAKEKGQIGMIIVRIGGRAYPIGVGGGSASSMSQGQNTEALDFNSVQRGNAEMENKTNRVIRTCVEMEDQNPIASIHDQGAGGPSNVLTELLEPLGGKINIRNIILGDKTMSVLKIWSAEYQEGYGLLIKPEQIEVFKSICERERVNCEVLGKIDGSGKITVEDTQNNTIPVDLNLEQILTNMPQKTFESTRRVKKLEPLHLPDVSVGEAIAKVFSLLSVGSKGYLVHKVDRSVTGLVAQQQCCGIAQIAIADASVNAFSHFDLTGSATALGEQPIKMLIDAQAGARMAVAEAITNLAGVKIRSFNDVRLRTNWMWPAKLPHEGAELCDAVSAMSKLCIQLGIAPDGGKDSLSMAAQVQGEEVKTPGSLVVYAYTPVPDVTKKVTPDIKRPGKSNLGLIDLSGTYDNQGIRRFKRRMGGSALAQAFNQLGDQSPDVDDPKMLVNAFHAIQQMIDENLILALHDRSDGGLITTVAEMCMASRCGFLLLCMAGYGDHIREIFCEELGLVLEYTNQSFVRIKQICQSFDVPFHCIGHTNPNEVCIISFNDLLDSEVWWSSTITELRSMWEATSCALEKQQMNPVLAIEEETSFKVKLPDIHTAPSYRLTFTPEDTTPEIVKSMHNPQVAVLREEGTNGDQEMAAAFKAAGLTPTIIPMSDLLVEKINLDSFQGLIFCGGFSYMDVFGSAKGWAGTILFNQKLKEMFDRFYHRKDTFSLGVCNGCQLMALLGWVPWKGIDSKKQPRFIQNRSGRFESRWVQVEIIPSPSVLLAGMEGSKLGIWNANGEGLQYFPDKSIKKEVERFSLSPLALLDPQGKRTESYPYNPNGSSGGYTALCSLDGRHLAMMPHPERCFRLWQWPWMPSKWKDTLSTSPWMRMFQNARSWCLEQM